MENQDAIKYIISKLRHITLAVQIAPFIYGFLCIVALLSYIFAPEGLIRVLDLFLYISPIVVLNNLLYSKILKLCKWHKTACILPLIPNCNVIIDRYIYEFSIPANTLYFAMVIVLSILLLITAYKVFSK